MEEEQKCICRRQKNLPIDLIVSYIQFLDTAAVEMCQIDVLEEEANFLCPWTVGYTAMYYYCVISSSSAEYAGNA